MLRAARALSSPLARVQASWPRTMPRFGSNIPSFILPKVSGIIDNYSKFSQAKESKDLFVDTHKLSQMQLRRVNNILLVCSLFDSYTFEEDNLLADLMYQEYGHRNLSKPPIIDRVSSTGEALEALKHGQYDLVISLLHLNAQQTNLVPFINGIQDVAPNVPLLLLAQNTQELRLMDPRVDAALRVNVNKVAKWESGGLVGVENAWLWPFVWQGNVSLFLAMIKVVEDRLNCAHDMEISEDLKAIILVEDNVKFYSSYLPMIYTELMAQHQAMLSDSSSPAIRNLKMRARTKLLLCTNYEEAMDCFNKFGDRTLGVITDVGFPRNGTHDSQAGLRFAKVIRERYPDMSVLMQSSSLEAKEMAKAVGTGYIHKGSPTLLSDMQKWMSANYGFGTFHFRHTPDGPSIARCDNISGLLKAIKTVPVEVIVRHLQAGDLSRWLRMRSDFLIAKKIDELDLTRISGEEARDTLLNWLHQKRPSKMTKVVPFTAKDYAENQVLKIGEGSLGGKGRGLRFLSSIIHYRNLKGVFPNVDIDIPKSLILCTGTYDTFIADNNLGVQVAETDDRRVAEAFMAADLPLLLTQRLYEYAKCVRKPLALRSSSMFEDAFAQPFAGVYQTIMVPNNQESIEERVEEISNAIKLVYASTFYQEAKKYANATQNRSEEEKMAVVIQEVAGHTWANRYVYPNLAGVALTRDFYPPPNSSATKEDGCAIVTPGLGATVVDGAGAYRFSLGDPKARLSSNQTHFLAMDLAKRPDWSLGPAAFDSAISSLPVEKAAKHGAFTTITAPSAHGATGPVTFFDVHGNMQSEHSRPHSEESGPRELSMPQVIAGESFPLNQVLAFLVQMGQAGLACPVEVEFAVTLARTPEERHKVTVLQMRPMASVNSLAGQAPNVLGLDHMPDSQVALIASTRALGHGLFPEICDVVYVSQKAWDPSRCEEMAREIGKLNERLIKDGRPYILIGPGRWGTASPGKGIPVHWGEISGARLIVETNLPDWDTESSNVAPSQGAHFFQNVTSFGIGYLTTDLRAGSSDVVDFSWMDELPSSTPPSSASASPSLVRHVRMDAPLEVVVDGLSGCGVVMKPGRPFSVYVDQANAFLHLDDLPYASA